MPNVVVSQSLQLDSNVYVFLSNATVAVMSPTVVLDTNTASVVANTITPVTLMIQTPETSANLGNAVMTIPVYSVSSGEPVILYDPITASQIWHTS